MNKYLSNLVKRYPSLEPLSLQISDAAQLLIDTVNNKGKILICGNGGSSADADHIVGELMKGFLYKRPITSEQRIALESIDIIEGKRMGNLLQRGIPSLSLSSSTALNTAFMNDVDPNLIFAQQVLSIGQSGDMLWALSTSGNSKNVVSAVIAAKAFGLKTLGMTGEKESRLSELCDICLCVKAMETYKIQELHLPIYHTLCLILEDSLFIRHNN